MSSKINIMSIVAEHYSTFRDDGANEYSAADFVVMLVVPIVVSVLASVYGVKIDDSNVGALISAFAIFAGLLFNVLVLIYSIKDKGDGDDLKSRLISQTFANVSFSVMLCLVGVFLMSALLFVDGVLQSLIEIVVYFLTLSFLLTMLMVLKRLHVLMTAP